MITTDKYNKQTEKLDRVKTTANRFAKQVFAENLEISFYNEEQNDCWKSMTEIEKEQVRDALNNQYDRIRKFIGNY